MPGIFPEAIAGGLVVRFGATGLPNAQPSVERAYVPTFTYVMNCDMTALPSDCTARIEPKQINAIVSELVALAEKFDPDGPWNCASLNNLSTSFTAWFTTNVYSKTEADARFVNAAGDTMTGPLAAPAVTTIDLTVTGATSVPTAAPGDADSTMASTAFVATAVAAVANTVPTPANALPLMDGVPAIGGTFEYAREDHVHPTDTSRAPAALQALPPSVNFNTVTTKGDYYTVDALSTNTPVAPVMPRFWYLEVQSLNPTQFVMQVATVYDAAGSQRYVRTMVATVWGAWRQIMFDNMAVRYDIAQALTEAQKVQARTNIGSAPLEAMAYNNKAINARCDVSQEFGLALPALVNGAAAKYCIDGWESMYATTGAPTVQSGQSNLTNAIQAPPGFLNCLVCAITAGNIAAPINSEYVALQHKVEGLKMYDMQWGTANAKTLTYAMMVYCFTTAGAGANMMLKFSNFNQTRCFYVDVPLPIQGWNFVSGTIPGDVLVSGTNWSLNNIASLFVTLFFNGKSPVAAAAGAWGGTNSQQTVTPTYLMRATNDTVGVTGLYLNAGTQVPTQAELPHLMRPGPQEQEICKRYCQVFSATVGAYLSATVGVNGGRIHLPTTVPFRTTPTITHSLTNANYAPNPLAGQWGLQVVNAVAQVKTGTINIVSAPHASSGHSFINLNGVGVFSQQLTTDLVTDTSVAQIKLEARL